MQCTTFRVNMHDIDDLSCTCMRTYEQRRMFTDTINVNMDTFLWESCTAYLVLFYLASQVCHNNIIIHYSGGTNFCSDQAKCE